MTITRPAPAAPPADRIAFLRNHPIFGVLGPELLQQLRSHALQKSVPRGTTLFSKGDVGTSLFAILDGQVKVVSFSAQGKNAVFNILGQGDIFGEIALLDGGERTADVTTLTDCKLLVIERRDFLPLVHSRPDIAQRLIEVLCARLRNTSRQVEEVMFLELPAKLAKTLLRLNEAATASGKDKVALTQSEIAQVVGASRESTNKQLREWEDRKWLRLERGGLVILSPDQLSEIAEAGE
jgi:CRP/FNR family transcriptional regulator, cyclic AMP receptor protein